MPNVSTILASSMTAIIVSVSVASVVFLLGAILFIWWVDTKKRPFKEFMRVIGDKFALFFGDLFGVFRISGIVKTVYSDKTLNYSGTEFLPIPTKAPTNQYSYEFVGWDKNGIDESGNIVVRAIYLQKVAMCKVTVFDSDSTLLGTYDVEYGSGLSLTDLKPHKNDTREFNYEFVGWDKDIDAFYKDEKVYAVYNAVPKKFNYKFLEEDGVTVVSEGNAIYGTPIVPPSPPKKESNERGLFEFAGWVGLDNNTILTRDIQFYASYEFRPYGKEGSSSIIKDNGETLKIVEESRLTPEEDSDHEKIKQMINESHVIFDTEHDENKAEVTEIKMGASGGVIRKRSGGYVQMNDMKDIEKFKKINTGEHISNSDKEVHQKIQLMTVKRTAEVETRKEEVQKVITVAPKDEPVTENEILSNMMINKIKIEKKQNPIAETEKKEEENPAKTTKATKTMTTTKGTTKATTTNSDKK